MEIIESGKTHKGKSYSDWIADWCNWFFMINPDSYNVHDWNDVKFLRSFPSPHKISPSSTPPVDVIPYEGSPMSLNTPNVMIGKERIVMYEDQAIFFPMILAVYYNDNNETWDYMQNWVKIQNSNSDDPPANTQILLDEEALPISGKMINYKLDTDGLFPLNIPDGTPSNTLKHHVLNPPAPGLYNAYCQGYFFLIRNLSPGHHTIVSHAKGASYEAGQYYASFMYEIEVKKKNENISSFSGNSSQIFDMMKDELAPKSTDDRKVIHEKERLIGIVEGFEMANEFSNDDKLRREMLKLYKARNEILRDYAISESETGIDIELFKDISKVVMCEMPVIKNIQSKLDLESLKKINGYKLVSLNNKKINNQQIKIGVEYIRDSLNSSDKGVTNDPLIEEKKDIIDKVQKFIDSKISKNPNN
ncbi:hypothetical protein BH23THE1_BH23THE1_13000 [soil metagenome]